MYQSRAVGVPGFTPEAVWEDALRILEEIGMEVLNDTAAKRLQGKVRQSGGRAYLAREVVTRYSDELRAAYSASPPEPFPFLSPEVSAWHCCCRDPASGETRPWTTEALTRYTKCLYRVAQDRPALCVHTPGYPNDVSPELAPLIANYIEFLYNPAPELKMVQGSVAHGLRIEMAKVMGMYHSFMTQTPSPLKFGGESVDAAIELYEPGMFVYIDTMPVIGISAPADWHAAWAQTVAENVGAYTILRLCGIEDAGTHFRLFVPNMSTGLLWFTSPKHLQALETRRQIREFFGAKESRRSELLLTTSKAPDQQAAAEKMAGCVLGALFGFDLVEGAGALYLDEVFSIEQFRVDMEIRDYVASMFESAPASRLDTLAAVREGVEAGSFIQTDLTFSNFEDFIWRPKLFDISTRLGWDGRALLDPSRYPSVSEMAEDYTYELSDERREGLDRIMDRARRQL